MMKDILTHKSPFVLVGKILIFEIVFSIATLVYFVISSPKTVLFEKYDLVMDISYEIFLVIIALQIVALILFFMSWFRETYSITSGKIIHKKGLLRLNETRISIGKNVNYVLKENILERIFRIQSLQIKGINEGEDFVINELSKNVINDIKEIIDPQDVNFEERNLEKVTFKDLLGKEEGKTLELKSTLRWDLKEKKLNKDLEKSIIKVIVSYLNTEGGILVIGVSDKHEILGLENDYKTLRKKNSDGFENHLNQIVSKYIGIENRGLWDMTFEKVAGKEICKVVVRPSKVPIFVAFDDVVHFFIKTGNSTISLNVSEGITYYRNHFQEKE